MNDIQAITFDIDGTLVDSHRMGLRRLWKLLPAWDVLRKLQRIREAMRKDGPVEDFELEQAKRYSKLTGLDVPQAKHLLDRAVALWFESFAGLKPYPQAHALIQSLRQRGIKVGVLSDFFPASRLSALDFEISWFGASINAESLGALKPHPKPFLEAAKQLGVAPEHLIHVGDREDCDVAGAHAAGMRAVLFDPKKKKRETQAEWRIQRYQDFETLVLNEPTRAPTREQKEDCA